MVSLGCDKNLVDSEAMLGLIRREGHAIVNEPDAAEVIVINTCGFISDAVRESISAALDLAQYKTSGVCRALIVAGCMVTRYKDEILAELPEADAILETNELPRIMETINKIMNQGADAPGALQETAPDAPAPESTEDFYINRVLSTHTGYAYLKIAEGCDSRCTYCTIPQIKGPYVSRPMDSLFAEAENLAKQGARELILVAQDTTLYGSDIYGQPSLDVLLRKLTEIPEILWLRIMYAYPENITNALIDEIAVNDKICKYLDIPVQHASDSVLKRMGRKSTETTLRALVGRLRNAVPGIALRTTLITGFPGETDDEFETLVKFTEDMRFDHLGVFMYSREEGSPAYRMRDQVSEKLKKKRCDEILKKQAEISLNNNMQFVSRTLSVITEGRVADEKDPEEFAYCGRTYRDSPDIDGMVFFRSEEEIISGEFVDVLITNVTEHDYYGRRVYESSQ